MIRSRIQGIGSYVPSRVVTNDDLKAFMDTTDEWIRQRTGIQERRWVTNETNSDLALKASERALAAARLEKSQIDLIILATLSPDHDFPGTGCYLQAKLGLPGVPALDIRQQCSGFVYGLSIADQFIRTGTYKNILLVGSEVHSTGLEKSTRGRDVTVLFGDGAGAAIVSRTEVKDPAKDAYLYSTHLHADGASADELCLPAPGCANGDGERLNLRMMEQGLHYPKMNGKKVFTSAVRRMSEVLMEGLQANGLALKDIDLFLFHQANLRINEAVAQQLEIPWEKVFNTIQKYGNTTAATLPLGMDDAIKEGKLRPGMRVAMAAFGSGFTWASALFRHG
jgi:3-oxoacyl-[acyl-carrier-protein] synthase III